MDAIVRDIGAAKSDDIRQALLAICGMLFARDAEQWDVLAVKYLCDAFGADLFKVTRTYTAMFEDEGHHAWDQALGQKLH